MDNGTCEFKNRILKNYNLISFDRKLPCFEFVRQKIFIIIQSVSFGFVQKHSRTIQL